MNSRVSAKVVSGNSKTRSRSRKKPWQPYIEAAAGFRNHWYFAFFSHELPQSGVSEGLGENIVKVKAAKLLGERILFRRSGANIYAIEDRCIHKGVPFSVRPECFTDETITCWYHGFTYRMSDGLLRTIISDPASPLIGKVKLKTYPVVEVKGLVFVFIGDIDPPPLSHDLPPGLLDDNFVVYPEGWSKTLNANWRLGAENGFDPAHSYLHRNSALVRAFHLPTVMGDTGISESHGMQTFDGPGPKGILLIRGAAEPIWEADIEPDVTLTARFIPGQPGVVEGLVPQVSIWMPGVLKVEPFPAPDLFHFEWYVPVDENHHNYVITWGRYVESDDERDRFFDEVTTLWKPLVPTTFNNEDQLAREAMQNFYANEDGWYRERLFGPDIVVTRWRELASRSNRGIQPIPPPV